MITRLIAETLTPIVTKSRVIRVRGARGIVSNRPYLELEITEASLEQLYVRALREIIEGIRTLSDESISKSGKKEELIERIMTSPQKEII